MPQSGLTAAQVGEQKPKPAWNPWDSVRFDDVPVADDADEPGPQSSFLSGSDGCATGYGCAVKAHPARDAAASMSNLRDRVELVAERVARQVGVLNDAKMEAFGHVEDLEALDGSSFEETLNGRLGLLEYQLDRLENTIVNFGSTH